MPDINRFVFFGDSLTEDGDIFELTSQVLAVPVPTEAAGYTRKFTNGQTYAEVLPGILDATDVENYAVGGARAVGTRPLEEFISENGLSDLILPDADPTLLAFDTNLGGQVQRFAASGTAAQPGTAAVINIGVNDYSNFFPTSVDTAEAEALALLNDVISTIFATASTLAALGVEKIILYALPEAAFFPFFAGLSPERQALGDLVFSAHNDALQDAADNLISLGRDVEIVDIEALSAEIIADPSTFGFTAPLGLFTVLGSGGDPVIIDTPEGPELVFGTNPAVEAFDADQIAFFDAVHPTAALHGVKAAFSAESLRSDVSILDGAADMFFAGRGADLVFAGGDDGYVDLRRGDDVAFGGLGNDTIRARLGDDIAAGGSGDDLVLGNRGNDVIAGNAGDDILLGGRGDDLIVDGLGSDVARGGEGDDVFVFVQAELIGGTTGDDDDVFRGGEGFDTLYLVLDEDTQAAIAGTDFSGRRFEIEEIGVSAISVEEVIILSSRAELEDLDAPGRVEEAALWGLI